MSRTLSEIPLTVAGVRAAMESRRDEATRALAFLREVDAFDRTFAARPEARDHGRRVSAIADDAWADAVECLFMWATARRELRRLSESEGCPR